MAMVARDEKTGRFLVGNGGNGGRQKGARSKLSEAFLEDLYEEWKAHGAEVIEEVRQTRPAEFLRMCAMVVRGASDGEDTWGGVYREEIEKLIEERHQKAKLEIAQMRAERNGFRDEEY
jgi:hypothetical protein